MNRYATNKFDFIRGWRNAAGSRVITEAGPAQLAVAPTPALAVNLVATPAPVSTPTPVPNLVATPAPVSSNTSTGGGSAGISDSGLGGGGGGSSSKVDSGDKIDPVKSALSVKDKVNTFLFLSMMVTGLYLVGTNVKFGKQGK
ncbi:MAG TPA: hypothetical protein PK289_04465 [Bacteroidia bacterium]|nr:hypothetical protein [Bacteroidia bacterium]